MDVTSFLQLQLSRLTNVGLLLLILTAIVAAAFLYLRFFYVDIGSIQGIPEVPGASLLHGHIYQLGNDHSTTLQQWAKQYEWPIFQIRLGNRRVVVLNGFDVARDWIVANQAHTIDRPLFYTFHGVVSKTSASTIGTNPWNERTKKQRRVVGSLTTAPAIKRLVPMLDLETSDMISSIFSDSEAGSRELMPHIYQKRLSLNIVLMFCYGRRFEDIHDPLLHNILNDASIISSFRSTNSNAQDYVPYLRHSLLQDKKRMQVAAEVRARRDKWLEVLLEEVKDNIASGTAANCVAAGLLTDKDEKLTKLDVRTILGGLMSGGFETVFATAIAGIAYLSSPEGQLLQEKAYNNIIKAYGTAEDAFEQAVAEEKSEYMVAFVRETLRHYPPLHLLPPRQTIDDFQWGTAKIPKGVMILVNCQAANHDPAVYGPDADLFRPERWLEAGASQKVPAPYQWAFGGGSRVCTAVNFSNRILYSIFVRLIVTFKIRQSEAEKPSIDHVAYNRNTAAQSAIPKDFKAFFELRDRCSFEACMERSRKNTEDVTNGMIR
ncbi:Amino acid permease [Pleurostoma richardsiae]|uniref:Amino acid permease n=1 Tax=Pleurostoma richardsiae TaxID=41990 RepID=A0AA38RZH0_9PEZI|nr:Amino acid permease [Pleurostoma richardsiae]